MNLKKQPDIFDENTSKPQPTSRLQKLRQFLEKHRLAAILICGILLVFIGGATAFWLTYQPPVVSDNSFLATTKKPAPAKKYYSPLSGLEVTDEAATKQAVTGVMIENSPDSRPQSGLKTAGVVYEAVAEGGITRFLALYQGEKPALIGPVRSLRLYYLGWASPYQASIAHVGGSENALREVRSSAYRDIDQSYNNGYYWRSTDRYAPHNVYTSGEKLDQLNSSKGYTSSEFTSFPRVDEKPAETSTATSIAINFSSALYNTSYTYDASSNSYLRNLAGAAHLDREGGQITPKAVVAIEVGVQRRNNVDYYEDAITTGSGKAYVFQNGTVVEATWSRDSFTAPLKLTDLEGKEIELVRGQTWIAAFTPGRGGVSWQ